MVSRRVCKTVYIAEIHNIRILLVCPDCLIILMLTSQRLADLYPEWYDLFKKAILNYTDYVMDAHICIMFCCTVEPGSRTIG